MRGVSGCLSVRRQGRECVLLSPSSSSHHIHLLLISPTSETPSSKATVSSSLRDWTPSQRLPGSQVRQGKECKNRAALLPVLVVVFSSDRLLLIHSPSHLLTHTVRLAILSFRWRFFFFCLDSRTHYKLSSSSAFFFFFFAAAGILMLLWSPSCVSVFCKSQSQPLLHWAPCFAVVMASKKSRCMRGTGLVYESLGQS